MRTKRAAISAADPSRPLLTIELDKSTSTATVTGPFPASKNAIFCGLPFSRTVKWCAASPSTLFPCLSFTCTLTVCRSTSERRTGSPDWGGAECCTQKEVPPKARWGEAAVIVEMPNKIAISTHRPEEKCRDMGSLCHSQHGPLAWSERTSLSEKRFDRADILKRCLTGQVDYPYEI